MEFLEMISDVNWTSFDSTMSVEGSDMMAQLLGTAFPNADGSESSRFWNDHNADNSYQIRNAADLDPFLYCYSRGLSLPPTDEFQNCYSIEPISVPPIGVGIEFCVREDQVDSSYIPGDQVCSAEETISTADPMEYPTMSFPGHEVIPDSSNLQPKRKFDDNFILDLEKDNDEIITAIPKKKSRSTSNAKNSTGKKRSKKYQKNENKKDSDEEERYGALNGQSTSCYSSDDDSNASNLKTRAGRGSATDPQSLYARKRRERINERLRILQNLVPNGTKVDISTMLEEAVNYVKFLQLQIKLLSSDDLWMYAPLAYNGMDIDLNLHHITTKKKTNF